jgi:chromosome partitioning protein
MSKSEVIVLATSKGGAGKSTLVRNLAAHWFNLGRDVAVIDADPQASIYNRHDLTGPLGKLPVIAEPEENVQYVIEELKNKHQTILVDTGGFRNRTTIRALIKADLAIIPLKASADDLASAVDTHTLIKELNETADLINNPIKYRMVLTMTQQGTVISRHIRQELEGAGYAMIKGEMYHRVAYPEAAINGLSPCITDPEGAAARDIAVIVKEISEIIKL